MRTQRIAMVLCDGLGDQYGRERMGYLEHLVAERAATRYTGRAAIPTNSKPNYETLHTGLAPIEHGIVSNETPGPSRVPNILALAHAAGLTTAAVAFWWFSELYTNAAYDPMRHCEYDNPESPITHGRFYQAYDQPDSELMYRAVAIARRFSPDYVLVHPMRIDHAGHVHGRDSGAYERAVTELDNLLATVVPVLKDQGYSVLVTSDHGHDGFRSHGGTGDDVRRVPIYGIRADGTGMGAQDELIDLVRVAPTICRALGLEPPASMRPSVRLVGPACRVLGS